MERFNAHFRRTLSLVRVLSQGKETIGLNNALFDQIELKETSAVSQLDSEIVISEILSIENLKSTLGTDDSARLKFVREQEKKNYFKRKAFLEESFEGILEKTFVLNPLVTTHESQWHWNLTLLEFDDLRFFTDIFSMDSPSFFIFQETGTYFQKLFSNILELPVSEYQYYLLSLATEPIKICDLIKEFSNEFEVNTDKEAEDLNRLTVELIRELIFRTYIISNES